MSRYVCIHGHFYQPPRENPWLEAVEVQDSAYPYHDWNERIVAECYAPNSISRILDGEGWIVRLVNNYSRISFNFGPTLLAWMSRSASAVYEAVREADRESQKLFAGHGAAIAQAYNHMILPLANRRDRMAQVKWGIRDFEHHFGRSPEGMWLPETAVDLETLEILAGEGIRFTILSPLQAKRVRYPDGDWQDVASGTIDPSTAYACRLPSGGSIALFFYDGNVAHDVAFGSLLAQGESFADRIMGCFPDDRSLPRLVHIATDGETYGHHHHRGDMALAYALDLIASREDVRLTVYGEYLELHPPSAEVEIIERSSWSCPHGVERWFRDCGCNSGGRPDWNQQWREPLRNALDWLRDSLAAIFEREGAALFKEPWVAREDYVQFILDRSSESMKHFLSRHAGRRLGAEERVRALKLMEMQRHAMLMYTSCGWFFDEISGIETQQIIQYAGRAIQLADEITGESLEGPFLERLKLARSNIPQHRDGRRLYERFVKPAILDLSRVCAHYAISSLFGSYSGESAIFSYDVHREDFQTRLSGSVRLAVGRACVTSEITQETLHLIFAVLYFGEHTLSCGVRGFQGEKPYKSLVRETFETFHRADFAETLRLIDRYFGTSIYSLKTLFRDEQRRILDLILQETLQDAEAVYRQLYKPYGPFMRFMKEAGIPAPQALSSAAMLVVNAALRRLLQQNDPDISRIQGYLEQAEAEDIPLDLPGLEFTLRKNLEQMADSLGREPQQEEHLRTLGKGLELLSIVPFPVNLWRVQNTCYAALRFTFPEMARQAAKADESAQQWLRLFRGLCEKLSIRVPEGESTKPGQ
jgi:alpha-amylase/alpha-mannosidase (GH57 family)